MQALSKESSHRDLLPFRQTLILGWNGCWRCSSIRGIETERSGDECQARFCMVGFVPAFQRRSLRFGEVTWLEGAGLCSLTLGLWHICSLQPAGNLYNHLTGNVPVTFLSQFLPYYVWLALPVPLRDTDLGRYAGRDSDSDFTIWQVKWFTLDGGHQKWTLVEEQGHRVERRPECTVPSAWGP